MTATAATITVDVTPDLTGLADKVKASIAAELRRLADELDPATPPALPVAIIDADGDRWAHEGAGVYRYQSEKKTEAQIERAYGIRSRLREGDE
jgi:hypothetical protein